MRFLVDLKSHLSSPPAPQLLQVQRSPAEGTPEPVNGRFVVSSPLDLGFPVGPNDYLLDPAGLIDGGDLISLSYAQLLAQYPQYSAVYFNPLLTADHVAEIVTDDSAYFLDKSVSPYRYYYSRFQSGTPTGGATPGQMPGNTAILPVNASVSPVRPGLLLTRDLDIGPYTLDCDGNPQGSREFLLYWKLFQYQVTEDITSPDAGLFVGVNEPAVRSMLETNPEPSGFSVYISTDGGVNWNAVGFMEPISFQDRTTSVRLAFLNTSSAKIFLSSFALLF